MSTSPVTPRPRDSLAGDSNPRPRSWAQRIRRPMDAFRPTSHHDIIEPQADEQPIVDEKSFGASEHSLASSKKSNESSEDLPPTGPVSTAGEDEEYTPIPVKPWMACVIVGGSFFAAFLIGFDITMLSVVVPYIAAEFNSGGDVGWYQSAYTLATCIFVLPSVKFYSNFRNKWVFIVFLSIFLCGSLICALATNSIMLIVGRAINGVGAGGVLGGMLTIIMAVCNDQYRPLITSIALSLLPIGSIVSPLVSGSLTVGPGWRWCFWIFLPIGGITLATTTLLPVPDAFRKPHWKDTVRKLHKLLDPVGFLLFTAATVMFLLAIEWGGSTYPWVSATILCLFIFAALVYVMFGFWVRYKGDEALLPLSVVSLRAVPWGCAIMFLQGSMDTIIYYLPQWFQAIFGDSAITASVKLLPSTISQCIFLVVFGACVRPLGYLPPWGIVGGALEAIGSGLLSTLNPSCRPGMWIAYQVIAQMGQGFTFQLAVIAVQETSPPELGPSAAMLVNLFLTLGIAVGISIGQSIFSNTLTQSLAVHFPGVDAASVLQGGAKALRTVVPEDQLPVLINDYSLALTRIWLLPAVAAALSVFLSCGLPWKRIASATREGSEESEQVEHGEQGSEESRA